MKINKLYHNSDNYPSRLLRLADRPHIIHVMGNQLYDRPLLAVIGSRRSTGYGQRVTQHLVNQLVKAGIGIVSGLAIGIDAAAHQAALKAGGYTMAVLPSGLPDIYPRSHQRLAQQILKAGGCLISEQPRGSDIYKHSFIARNRIIAALVDGIVVIEAAEKSGTLSTVGFGLDLGVTIFAVPGAIDHHNSKGTNQLLKLGAVPVTDADDITNELGIEPDSKIEVTANNQEEQIILDILKSGKTELSHLMSSSKLPMKTVHQTLTQLELRGIVTSLSADKYLLN